MPISKYYGGHGEKVMASMKKQYGDKAEEVFYATANKKKKKHAIGPSENFKRGKK